ncbi:MAG: citrate transporter [Lachnospirales bacterium]
MEITFMHILYIVLTILILVIMVSGREIVVPCIFAIFLIGFFNKFSIIDGMSGLFNSVVFAGQKFMEIILTISIVSALSKLLSSINSDYLIMKPTEKFMKNQFCSFVILVALMYLFSLFLWPSPTVALMGAVMLPIVYKKGMKPIVAAVGINIAGHGMALSHDFVIKGAPSVTASTANITPEQILKDGNILFILMNITVLLLTFVILRKDFKSTNIDYVKDEKNIEITKASKIIAIMTPLFFLVDLIVIKFLGLKGGDATSLIVASSIFLLITGTFLKDRDKSFDTIVEYLKEGFTFGIKIFTPVIFIGAFFFLGGSEITQMLGEITYTSEGILTDIVLNISSKIPLNNFFAVISMVVMGIITGLDGSGFSGLPILGSLAYTLGESLNVKTSVLAAIGQISTIWVGGGVLIPWSVVTVSGICNVSPMELIRKNFIPVISGFIVVIITALFIL